MGPYAMGRRTPEDMELSIITPVIRKENLMAIEQSIITAAMGILDLDVTWIAVFDQDGKSGLLTTDIGNMTWKTLATPSIKDGVRVSLSGNGQRNMGIDLVNGGHVYFLDDDTLMHPNLLKRLVQVINENHCVNVAFNQARQDGSTRLVAAPESMRATHVDTGQVLFHRSTIGAHRWETLNYCADGVFIESVYNSNPAAFVFINETLATYNALRS